MVDKTELGIADLIGDQREDILRLAQQHKAFNVRIFGSVARGEARPESDLDIVVNFRSDARIWDMVGLWHALTELTKREVDLVEEAALSDDFLANVQREAVQLC